MFLTFLIQNYTNCLQDWADNIWETKHMNLIIPSLLFNLETGKGPLMEGRVTPELGDLDSNGADQEESAWAMADKILREVVNSATSISIKVSLWDVAVVYVLHL